MAYLHANLIDLYCAGIQLPDRQTGTHRCSWTSAPDLTAGSLAESGGLFAESLMDWSRRCQRGGRPSARLVPTADAGCLRSRSGATAAARIRSEGALTLPCKEGCTSLASRVPSKVPPGVTGEMQCAVPSLWLLGTTAPPLALPIEVKKSSASPVAADCIALRSEPRLPCKAPIDCNEEAGESAAVGPVRGCGTGLADESPPSGLVARRKGATLRA